MRVTRKEAETAGEQQIMETDGLRIGDALSPRSGRIAILALALSVALPAAAFALCADDAVAVGRLCVDKYEASVWSKPPGGEDPGTQYGVASDDYPCAKNGQDCDRIYAASRAGALPSEYATWFQAQQACANVGKRLLTNAEWQMAVQGTPDAGPDDREADCNTDSAGTGFTKVPAGSRQRCVSIYGARDMVGNVMEWVADWVPFSDTTCPGWGSFSDDQMCFTGAVTNKTAPGVLVRGGANFFRELAGPLTVNGTATLTEGFFSVGFRCVR